MVKIVPQPIRFQVAEDPGQLCVVIPVKTNWFVFVFLSIWLCGWAVGEVVVTLGFFEEWGQIRGDPATIFLAVWLVFWTVAGAVVLSIWLWNLIGQEVLRLGEGSLVVRRDLLGIGRSREFDLTYAREFRIPPQPADPLTRWWFGGIPPLRGGSVAFDYGARTFHFGSGLDEAEAKFLLDALRPHLPATARAQCA